MSRRSTRRSSSVDPEDSADEAPSSRRSSRVTRSTLSVRETTTTRELRTPAATSGLGQYDQYDSGRPAARTRRSRAAEPSSSVDVSDILEEPDPDLFRVYPSPRSPSRVKAQEDAAVYRTDVCDSHDLEHLVTGFHAHAPHRATNLTAKSSIRTVSQKHYSLTSPNPRAHSHSHSHAHGPAGHDDHVDEPEDSSDPEEPETSDVEEPGGGDVDPEGVDGTEEPEVEERAPRSFFGGLSCNLCSRNQDDADEDVVTVEDEPKHAGGDDEPTEDGQPDDSAVGDEQGVDAEPQEAEPSDEPGDDVEQSGDEVEEPGGDVDEPAEPADGGDDGSDVDGPEEPEPEPVDNGRPVDPNDPSGFVPLYDRIVGLCCATRQPADYPVECEDTSDDEVVLSADPSEPIELKAPARASKPASSQDSGDEDPDEVDPEPQEPASAAPGGDDGGDDVEAPQNPDEPVDVSGEDKPGFVPLYDRLLNLCRSAPSAEDEDDVNPDAAEPADDSGDEVEAPAKSVSPDDNGAGDDSGEEAAPPKPKAASADGRASSPLDEPASGDKSDSEPDDGVDGGEEVERKPRRPTALTSWLLLPFTVLSTLLSALGSAFVWFAQYLSGDDRDIEIWEAPIHVSLVYQPPVKSVETGGPSRGSQVEEEPIEEPADVDVDNGEAPDDNVEEPADGVEDPDEQSAPSSDVDVDDGSDVDVDVEAPAHTSGAEPGEGGDFVENQGREGQSSETTSEPFDWRSCSRLWLPLALLLLLLLLLWASPLLVNWMLAFKGKPDCEHWKNCYKSVIGDIIIEQGGVGVVPGVILDSEVQKIKEAIVKELKPLSAEQVKEIVTKQTDPIAKKQEEFASQSEQSKKSVERQILDLQQTKQDSAKVQPLIDQAVGSAEEKSKQEIRAFQSKLDDAKQSILAEVNKLIAQIPKQPQTQTGTVAPATGATLTPEQLAEINKGVSDLSTRLEAFKGEVDKRFLALPAPGTGSSSGAASSGISQQQLDSLKTDLLSELEKIKAQAPQHGSSAPVNEDAIVEKVLARIKTSSPEDLVAVQHQVQTVSAKLDELAPAASVETLRVQYVELNTLFQNFVNKKNDDSNPNQQLPSDVSESLNKLSGDLTALKADLDKASTEIATIKAAQDSLPGAEALEALKAVDSELAGKLDAHTKEVGDRLQELKASLGATDAIQALQTDLAAATQRLGELEAGQAAAIKSAEDTQALVSTLSGSLEAQDNAFKQLQQLAKDLESQKISEAGALALIQNELKDHGKDALSVSDLYKILDKFSADRAAILSGVYQAPDLVDYAVQYAGGRVMLAETTRLVPAQTGLLADLIRTTHNNPHAAEELIKPDMDLGRCWAMAGSKGCVVIQLSKEIIPSSFTVEHPSHVIATDYSTAPKRLVFSGISEFDVTKKPRCADVHGDRLSVANYKEKDFQMQNFPSAPANNAVGKSYRFIKVDIEENHGNAEYTCIYRIRVQGKPVAAPPAVDANQPGSKRPAGARP